MAPSDYRGPPAVKSRIWTSQPKAGAQHWRCEDIRAVLPIARGAEIFAERWTPLIIRNLYFGCGSFSEILEGAPGLSRTLLSQRLKQLERLGVVGSAPKADGRGHHYRSRLRARTVQSLHVARRVGGTLTGDRPGEPQSICGAVVDVQRAPTGPAPGSTRRHPLRLHRPPAPRTLLATIELRPRLQDVPGRRRRPLHHRGRRTLSNGTPASSPGRKLRGRAASNSTASRRWSELSQPGTPAACSPTSGRSPARPQAKQADILDGRFAAS